MEKLPWKNIQLNQESGLTDVQLKWDPSVVGQDILTAHPICCWSPWTTDNISITTVRDNIGIISMTGGPQNYNRPEADHRRYSQALLNTNNDSTTVVLDALECFFSQACALAQSTLNGIQEYNGSDRESTISWLDQVELVAKRTGFDPLEVGISKLKGLALGDISTDM